MIGPPHRLVQRRAQTAKLGAKRPIRAMQLANLSTKQETARRNIGPVDRPAQNLGPVKAPRFDIGLAHGSIAQRAKPLGIVHRKPRPLRQRQRRQPAIGAKDKALKRKIAIMVGKTKPRPILAHNPPATRHGGQAIGKMGIQIPAHTRTSTTGTFGTSPAWKFATLV